jgi:hypothetical protein
MFKIRIVADGEDRNENYHELEHLAHRRFLAKAYQTAIYQDPGHDTPLSDTCNGLIKKKETPVSSKDNVYGSGGRTYKPRNYGSMYNNYTSCKKLLYGKTGRKKPV